MVGMIIFAFLASTLVAAAADAANGKVIYDRLCVTCHGPGGKGASGPALNTRAVAQRFDTPDKLRTIIRQGAKGMPAFGDTLIPDRDLDDLLAYLTTLVPVEATATPAPAVPTAPPTSVAPPAAPTIPTTAPVTQTPESPQSALSLDQVYAVAVFLLAILNGVVMIVAWLVVNRRTST